MARLGDVFSVIRNGISIRQTDGAGGLPITRIETISNREIDRSKFGYAGIEDADKYREYILQDGDILMSHINSEKHLGKVALYKKQGNEKIIHGMNLLMLRANKSIVYPPFATYFFATNIFLGQIQKITKKSVNQASFTVSALKEIEMDLPALDEQRRIASVLDKVNDLIAKRRQQLEKLDELVKARFVEMFGQIRDMVRLEEYTSLITKGASPKWQGIEYAEDGTLFITSENVRGGYLDLSKRKYLDKQINLIQPRSILKKGDILINIVGASIGRAAIYIIDDLANINQAIALVRVKVNVLNLKFLLTYLNSTQVLELYNKMKKGGARDNLSLKNISDLLIPKAPLALQNEFAAFVEQTEKTKTTISRSLEKLETLKKALMQEYFG